VEVQTLQYPGFPTDLQASFATLLTQAEGTSLVHERVYDNRLQYAAELCKMGASINVTGQTASIHGPSPLNGAAVKALDIRAGAAVVLAALSAEGVTEISDIHHISRGYEKIDERLVSLGASVERVVE
jgi:UDP-N-acetylglucosamine 1-carboxyvinyltransferase